MPLPDLPGGLAAAQAFEAEQAILRAGFGLPPVRGGALKIEHFQDYKVKPFQEEIKLKNKQYDWFNDKKVPQWMLDIRNHQKNTKDLQVPVEKIISFFKQEMKKMSEDKKSWCQQGRPYMEVLAVDFVKSLLGEQEFDVPLYNEEKRNQRNINISYDRFLDIFSRRCVCVCSETSGEIKGFALYHFEPRMGYENEIKKPDYNAIMPDVFSPEINWMIHIDVIVSDGCGARIMESIGTVAMFTRTPDVDLDSMQYIKFDKTIWTGKTKDICKIIKEKLKNEPDKPINGVLSLNQFYRKLGYYYAESHTKDETQRMQTTFPMTIHTAYVNTLARGILNLPLTHPPETPEMPDTPGTPDNSEARKGPSPLNEPNLPTDEQSTNGWRRTKKLEGEPEEGDPSENFDPKDGDDPSISFLFDGGGRGTEGPADSHRDENFAE